MLGTAQRAGVDSGQGLFVSYKTRKSRQGVAGLGSRAQWYSCGIGHTQCKFGQVIDATLRWGVRGHCDCALWFGLRLREFADKISGPRPPPMRAASAAGVAPFKEAGAIESQRPFYSVL